MSSQVPWKRTNPRYQEVQIAAPPRGRLWQDTALLYHWIRAHGMHVVPAHSPRILVSPLGSRVLRWRVHPGGSAIARVWAIRLRGIEPTPPDHYPQATVTFPDAGVVTLSPFPFTVPFATLPPILYVEELGAKSGTEQELAITVAHVAGDVGFYVESVSCVELPRAVLTQDATDLGVDLETLRPGQPIYDDTTGNRSWAALAANLAATDARRSLLQYALPSLSVSSESPRDLFALPVPVLPRKIGRTDTTRPIAWDVYSRASTADTKGTITIATGLAGDSQVISLDGSSSTAFAWHSPAPVTAACEDLSTDDGLPAGGWETVQVTIARTEGTGSIQFESVSIFEAG